VSDFVIRTGDLIQITIPSAVIPALQEPVPLRGSAESVTVSGLSACLSGDELPEMLRAPTAYTAAPFTVPGSGTLTLTLAPSNLTVTTRNGKPLLIKGSPFTAAFTVAEPATQPTPTGPVPDPLTEKTGTAQFITSNETVRAG
jgi:hypothetical protein